MFVVLVRQAEEGACTMTKKANGSRYLPYDKAVMLMHHKGTRMTRMNTRTGPQYFVLPHGGPIKTEDAEKILSRPDISGQKDCLFPGLDQTWTMTR
jgi:hypothetical protein